MARLSLVVFIGLPIFVAAYSEPFDSLPQPPVSAPCPHGMAFLDECLNRCKCQLGGVYSCTEKACFRGTPGVPKKCYNEGQVRQMGRWRIECKRGIIRVEPYSRENWCTAGTSWKEDCNTCICLPQGTAECTALDCSSHDEGPFLCRGESCRVPPSVPGSGGQQPEVAEKEYCSGRCPSYCREVFTREANCYFCECKQLDFGDIIVPADQACPAALIDGGASHNMRHCQGLPCTPGASWRALHDGCSKCICTPDGEPACTPCQRGPTEFTRTCEDGARECPQDCGSSYNAFKDCFDCPCSVGEPGDFHVPFEQPCPPGTDFRESGAFFKACGHLDTLPKGDTKLCGTLDCPADCGTVRISRQENCAYCQCGPELSPGDVVVPISEDCPPTKIPGPNQMVTKVCKAPTREKCIPGITYNIGCDLCQCQEDGVPACTARNCSDPKYGDMQVCGSHYRECPADCVTMSSDSFCVHCRCDGAHSDGEDTTIPSAVPYGGGGQQPQVSDKRYCTGRRCPSTCREVLDSVTGCYDCECQPLDFGDTIVPANQPCPAGLSTVGTSFNMKHCRGRSCTPGATWSAFHDGCSKCFCTPVGDPACTPCQTGRTEFTMVCGGGGRQCPADCGSIYNATGDCLECSCGVGESGDVSVPFDQPCPRGFDFRANGAFSKVCGRLDTLPKGDTKFCGTLDCPADCGTVRISRQENCAYCQCGPELSPGDVVVPIHEECPPTKIPGPTQMVTKVCKAPTREACVPGETFNIACNACICRENGIPACTLRDCSDSGPYPHLPRGTETSHPSKKNKDSSSEEDSSEERY